MNKKIKWGKKSDIQNNCNGKKGGCWIQYETLPIMKKI